MGKPEKSLYESAFRFYTFWAIKRSGVEHTSAWCSADQSDLNAAGAELASYNAFTLPVVEITIICGPSDSEVGRTQSRLRKNISQLSNGCADDSVTLIRHHIRRELCGEKLHISSTVGELAILSVDDTLLVWTETSISPKDTRSTCALPQWRLSRMIRQWVFFYRKNIMTFACFEMQSDHGGDITRPIQNGTWRKGTHLGHAIRTRCSDIARLLRIRS